MNAMAEERTIPPTILTGRYVVRCGYCRRSARDVRRLLVVPGGFVCDVCVTACAELIAEADQHPIAPDGPKVMAADLDTQCAVCDTIVQHGEIVMVQGRGGPVCKACVESLVDAWFTAGDQGPAPQ